MLRNFRIGWLALVVSVVWLIWIVGYLPSQSISYGRTCTELSSSTNVPAQTFVKACEKVLGERPEDLESVLLLVSCILLVILSVAMFVRERALLKRMQKE